MVKLSGLSKWTFLLYSCSLTLAGPVQVANLQLPATAAGNQTAVKNIFLTSYNAYITSAFGHDELLPESPPSFVDDLNGWGGTIADALGTLILMGFDDLFDQALEFITTVNFSQSAVPDQTTDIFETTIRYSGGMLSAYELTGKQHEILVTQTKALTDKMAFAWASPDQKVPFSTVNFADNSIINQLTNVAEAGTLDLEWSRLSLYTGNQTYTDLTVGSVLAMANQPGPFPGLIPQLIDPNDAEFADDFLTWGGGTDSYLEYLIKYARLSNTDDNIFADTWHAAVDSSIKVLLRTSTVGNHTYLGDWNAGTVLFEGSHLACYMAGNWILGGKLLNNETIVNIGLQLNDGCWNTYASTATGIGPETFEWMSENGENSEPDEGELEFYNEHGFWITASDYVQRPEVLESNFYAWRATGNTTYLDRAWSAIQSFETFLNVGDNLGYAGLNDVNDVSGGLQDETQTFWFAEVLKYLYLTFDDPQRISLDNFVFNTECQVFEAPPAKAVYGSGTPAVAPGQFQSKTSNGLPVPAISPGTSSMAAGPLIPTSS